MRALERSKEVGREYDCFKVLLGAGCQSYFGFLSFVSFRICFSVAFVV